MPKLWTDTLATHRREVRDAILDATASLVVERGLRSVTMSEIATLTGIGRATLYKYFPDVDAILLAWHERQIEHHLGHLMELRDQAEPERRLEAVLEAYALIMHQSRGHHDAELEAFLHRDEEVPRAMKLLREMLRDLISDAAKAGTVRADVAPAELATFCLHALGAAGSLPSAVSVRRLVIITLAGLRTEA